MNQTVTIRTAAPRPIEVLGNRIGTIAGWVEHTLDSSLETLKAIRDLVKTADIAVEVLVEGKWHHTDTVPEFLADIETAIARLDVKSVLTAVVGENPLPPVEPTLERKGDNHNPPSEAVAAEATASLGPVSAESATPPQPAGEPIAPAEPAPAPKSSGRKASGK